MVVLDKAQAVNGNEFCDDCSPLKRQLAVKIGDISYDEVVAVDTNGVALVDEQANVPIMTDQFLKHRKPSLP